MTPVLSQIRIFPLKALPALGLSEVRVLASGALAGDRRWAIFDGEGKFVNGKRHPDVHKVRATYESESAMTVSWAGEAPSGAEPWRFDLSRDSPGQDVTALEAWLSPRLGLPVRIGRDDHTGFPDDLNASGPTVISTATLETVGDWFGGWPLETTRRRFRANLEIGGVPPFWEDRLFGPEGTLVRFRLGDVIVEGVNPCQRCVVPARDPDGGEATPGFQKRLSDLRRESLPSWAEPSRFDHFYRLAVNTRVPSSEAGKRLCVGDAVVLGTPP